MDNFNFEQEVIEKSFEKPVLVDFWAPWCGPCRVLGPTIESLAEETDKWTLVKINTEEEEELARIYNIMNIPNVKLFHKGEVIGEFLGALSKAAIQKWLDEHLPDERKGTFEQLLMAYEASNDPALLIQLEQYVEDHPDLKEAKLLLAKIFVFSDVEKAKSLTDGIQMGDPLHETAEDINVLVNLMKTENADTPASQSLSLAKQALQSNEVETALQKIIEATTIDKSFNNDLPRKAAIALFHLLGNKHELTKKYRWRFDMALY